MSQFKTGFAKVNINPPLGSAIYGYYVPRYAKGFLDDLEIRAFALSLGEKKILMFSASKFLKSISLFDRVKSGSVSRTTKKTIIRNMLEFIS